MKKILCILLVLLIAFSFSSCSAISDSDSGDIIKANSRSTSIELISLFDLITELKDIGIDVNNSDEYDICILIGVKNDPEVNLDSLNISDVSVDGNIEENIEKHRQKVKDYYLSYNESVVSRLGFSKYDYCVSFYSPYVEIVFDDVYEYIESEKHLFASMQSNENMVSSASSCISYKKNIDASANSSEEIDVYPISEAFDDIGVTESQYTGQGIKVGVIESGYPIDSVNLKSGYYSILYDTFSDPQNSGNTHAQVVSSIIGGYTGIAEDVYFYFSSAVDSQYNSLIVSNANTLIDTYGVDIINISCGFTSGNGLYRNLDACIDSIISNTGCTFVVGAGNQGDIDDPYGDIVLAPGCSLNSITVGSIDSNGSVSAFSSWLTNNDYLLKPDVVAPGGDLTGIANMLDNDGNYAVYGGTSYSAPMLTGTIALLMEEFPILKIKPALVKSIIQLSAEKLAAENNYFDEYAGFGLINYQNMRDCMLESNYAEFSIPTTSKCVAMSLDISVPYMQQIEINANLIINSSQTVDNLIFTDPTYTDYTIMIYDYSTNSYVAASEIDSNVDYLIFPNYSQSNSSFRIDIVLDELSQSSGAENGVIAYTFAPATEPIPAVPQPMNHFYTHHYVWQSEGLHRAYCECGEFIRSSHTVRAGSFTGDGYGICLLCRGRVFMGTLNSIIANLPHTDNGSYILPNGVTVLVEVDINAYLAGTLEFYIGEKQ